MIECVNMVNPDEDVPNTFAQILKHDERKEWLASVLEEYVNLASKGTWRIALIPKGRKLLGCRLVMRRKVDKHGNSVEKEKPVCYPRIHSRRRHRLPSTVSTSSRTGHSAATMRLRVSTGRGSQVVGFRTSLRAIRSGSGPVHQMAPRNQATDRPKRSSDRAPGETGSIRGQTEPKMLGFEAA